MIASKEELFSPCIHTVSPFRRITCPERRGLSVSRVAEAKLPTEYGEFRLIGYRSLSSSEEFIVLAKGDLTPDAPTLIRIHSQCLTGDVFCSIKCDCRRQLLSAMGRIQEAGRGVIVYQQQEGRGIGIINKIRAYALQDGGADTIEANKLLGLEVDARSYEQCVEIFLDLGLKNVRVLSNNPEKLEAIEAGGLNVVERVPIEINSTDDSRRYLQTKKERLGHLLEKV